MRKAYALTLALLLTSTLASTWFLFNSVKPSLSSSREQVVVSRDIDGDTLDLTDGRRIRLANINAFEKNIPGSELASTHLKDLENKTIEMEVLGKDNRGMRYVARIYRPGSPPEYINLEMVREGLAPKAWVEKSERTDFIDAEREAVENHRGIWKNSPHSGCISFSVNPKKEVLLLTNSCPNLSWLGITIQDESRQRYKISSPVKSSTLTIYSGKGTNAENILYAGVPNGFWWNDDVDTVYVYDEKNNLLGYHPYGY